MFRKKLTARASASGLLLLFLLAPADSKAQLPDAPSAVRARQIVEIVGKQYADTESAPVDLAESADRSGTGFWKQLHFNLDSASAPRLGGFLTNAEWSSSSTDPDDPQETLTPAPKSHLAPGFSSILTQVHPVPGSAPNLYNSCPKNACLASPPLICCGPFRSPFARYLRNPDAVGWTARDNLHLAAMHVIDPFNLGTIVVDAAIGIASDSHTAYGPGVEGVAKYAGVSLTEDMTGEFFGTLLFPSLMHQDPRYHREPYVSIKRRFLHAVTQIVWTQSYSGKPMLNYGNIMGSVATAAVSNTFVPGPNRQGFGNTAQRLALAFAISPTGNLVAEFFPDVARRINLRVVIFQRILNNVAIEESGVSVAH